MIGVMDENFLKDRERAMELLTLSNQHQRWFHFQVFSSAETVIAFGIENLVRLGIRIIWIGFESQHPGAFAKNTGIDAPALVRDLRDHGIAVLASGILCMEHHTPDNITEDIDYLVDLKADMVQFMLLTGLPVTRLYQDLQSRQLLRFDLPFEEWHGQNELNYRHPAFPGNAPREWLDRAFCQEFEANFSTIFRMTETALRGYKWLASLPTRDACLDVRLREAAVRLRQHAMLLPVIIRHAVSPGEREGAQALAAEQVRLLGPWSLAERIRQQAALVIASQWAMRVRLFGDLLQPATIVSRYQPAADPSLASALGYSTAVA